MKHIDPLPADSPKRTSATAAAAAAPSVGPVAPKNAAAAGAYPNAAELNPLVGLVSSLVYKYRNMPTAVPINSNLSDQYLDELKNTVYFLEQQMPGSCDTFMKTILQMLKPNSNSFNSHSNNSN